MEQVLMDLIDSNPVYLAIMDARFEFYYEQHRRTLAQIEIMSTFDDASAKRLVADGLVTLDQGNVIGAGGMRSEGLVQGRRQGERCDHS